MPHKWDLKRVKCMQTLSLLNIDRDVGLERSSAQK